MWPRATPSLPRSKAVFRCKKGLTGTRPSQTWLPFLRISFEREAACPALQDQGPYAALMAEWWAVRRAHSRKPATYTCPLCGRQLHAMSEHLLIAPEDE